MRQLLLALGLAALLTAADARAQFVDTFDDLPSNLAGVGAAIGPTRADGAGWGAYARLLNRSTGTYSLTGGGVVPSLVQASNGLKQIALRTTVFTGVEQVVFKHGRVMAAIDAGIGAAMPIQPGGSVSFSGNYAGGILVRTTKPDRSWTGYVIGGARVTQIQSQFVPMFFVGHAWGWGK